MLIGNYRCKNNGRGEVHFVCLLYTYISLFKRQKCPFGAVRIAVKSMASGDKLPVFFQCWSCHLLGVILSYKLGVMIVYALHGVAV